ncbi:MAG: pilus assembly protein TadG-related protein [Pseudodonghicola sp.]
MHPKMRPPSCLRLGAGTSSDRRAAPTGGLGIALRRFARDENGNLIIFSIYVLVIMLMFGGIGIDLMHYERNCTDLQNTLDRATLAAADLDQPLDPEAVVRDYLTKAGVIGSLTKVTADKGMSHRVVTATATCSMATQFMQMSGVTLLSNQLTSTAEERIDGVEISLVLDVSTSMNANSKLANLKTAAKDFVDTMVDNTEAGNLSISIVPYATQVSTPAAFLNKFNVTREQEYSNCVNFAAADFNTTEIDPEAELKRTLHYDRSRTSFDGRAYTPERLVSDPVCSNDSAREMQVLQSDRDGLKTYIENLSASGNTSIDLGMKWGTALLDPSLKPVIASLVDDKLISAAFSDRPKPYTSKETLKVIVLMTDGENTSQYYLPDDLRTGASNVWWNPEAKEYSIYKGRDSSDKDGDGNTSEPIYYWYTKGLWRDHPYGNLDGYTETRCVSEFLGICWRYSEVTVDEPGTATELTLGELYARTAMYRISQMFEPVIGSSAWSKWYNPARDTYVGGTTKDTRTKAICDAAKAKGTIIYTIGFEAPTSGRNLLKYCASSDSHYFDVSGLEIVDAFSSIASSISKLKLTQ